MFDFCTKAKSCSHIKQQQKEIEVREKSARCYCLSDAELKVVESLQAKVMFANNTHSLPVSPLLPNQILIMSHAQPD